MKKKIKVFLSYLLSIILCGNMVFSSAMAYANRTRTNHYELNGQDIVMTIEYDEENIPVRSIVESDTYKVIAEKSSDVIDLTYIDKQNNEVQTKALDIVKPEQGQSNRDDLPNQSPELYTLTSSYTSKYFPNDWYKVYNRYDWLVCYGGDDVAAYTKDDDELSNLCSTFRMNLKNTDDALEEAGSYIVGGLPIVGDGYTLASILVDIGNGEIDGEEILLAILGLVPVLGKIISVSGVIAGFKDAAIYHSRYKAAHKDIVKIIRG